MYSGKAEDYEMGEPIGEIAYPSAELQICCSAIDLQG